MLRPKHKPETNLCEIIDQLGGYHPITSGNTEISVTGISMNSKVVQPGDLYAAVAGSQHHGADYIDQAIAAGAVAVLTDAVGIRRVPDQYAAIVVDEVRGALGDAAAFIYGNTTSAQPTEYWVASRTRKALNT